MSAFYFVTFKHRQQVLSQHVICPACRLADPGKLYEPTAVDDPSPYKTIVVPVYDRTCDECHAEPEPLPICATEGCEHPAGPVGHPYDQTLCLACGDAQAMQAGRDAYEQAMRSRSNGCL